MKISRLFNMLMLLSANRKMSSTELAGKLEVSVRTVYRDVEILSQAGIPIYTTTGKNGGIHLMDGYVIDKAMFSKEEQQKILHSLESFRSVPGMDMEQIRSKFVKLFNRQVLDEENWLEIDFSDWGNGNRNNDLFSAIKESILTQQILCISYINAKDEYKERNVEPIKLVFRQREWYLYAFCRLQMDFRWFKVSRIAEFHIVQEAYFQKHEHKCFQEIDFVSNDVEKTHLELLFTLNSVHFVYDIFGKDCIYRESDNQIRVSADYAIGEWTYMWIMAFGADVTILEPKWLKAEIEERHRKAIR